MSSEASVEKINSFIKYIFDILQKGDDIIKIHTNEEVVLVLGNTGAGKTTFTHFIAGDNEKLFSVEGSEGSGDYIIVDKENKISSNSTLISQTLFPDLIVDPVSKVAFYDCPGFSDTRSPVYDISGNYFVKKVIDSYKQVKLVLVVNYASVRKGVDRLDFLMLLKHVTNIIKNVDKMKDSIALIVSKVDNVYVKKAGNVTLVSDQKLIESIAEFLKRAKGDIQALSQNSNSPSFYDKALKLIDIFLQNDGNNYTKIGIFRRPDDSGVISEMPLLQSGKKQLENIIHNNTKFILRDRDDFGYSISAESKNYIHDLGKEINLNVESEISSLGKYIEHHISKEEESSHNIYELFEIFKLGSNLLLKYEDQLYDSLSKMAEDIITDIKKLKIDISHENITKFKNFEQYFDFFNTVSNQTIKEPLRWVQGFKSTSTYLKHGQKWYNFLIKLHNLLSEYSFQKNPFYYQINTTEDKNVPVTSLNLKPLIDTLKIRLHEQNIDRMFDEVNNLEIGRNKIWALKRVLAYDLDYKIEYICESSSTLNIRGKYVKLSDINNKHCKYILKAIKIFATQKVFIDIDLNKIGQKLSISIISPVWDVVGNRAIILDGKAGNDLGKARSGHRSGERGSDGMPGLPGGAAGHFFGVAGQLDGGTLTISADGGQGGRGQGGGDGAPGRRGDTPHPPSTGETRTVFDQWGPQHSWENRGFKWSWRGKDNYVVVGWYYYKAYGKPATDGANGGDGGVGGKGGPAGAVVMYDYSNSGKITKSSKPGMDGKPGEGGYGGLSANNGYNRFVDCRTDRYILVAVTYCSDKGLEYNGHSRRGEDGLKGANNNRKLSPEEPTPFINHQLITKQFQEFKRQSLNLTLGEPYIAYFYNRINNVKTSSSDKVSRIRRRRDIELKNTDFDISFPPMTNYASSIHKSSILSFARSSLAYSVALWKCIDPLALMKGWLGSSKIKHNANVLYKEDVQYSFHQYNKFEHMKISYRNGFWNEREFIDRGQYESDYYINHHSPDNDVNIHFEKIPLNTPSNLLLWDLFIRKFRCHKFQSVQTTNSWQNELSHDLAFRYYSPSNRGNQNTASFAQFEGKQNEIIED